MADDVPVPAVPPASATAPTVVAAYAPLPINLEEAQKQQTQYKADLEKTQGALRGVQGQRMGVTERNLKAIDESIQGLKDSRTGTYGFDPAVSAALAAGFLKTTPGVAGNFMSELGSAMGAAAPVIGSLQKQDRDSFQILADLHRKRGEFEAEPYKEQQTELSAREKLEFAALKESEKALARAPAPAAATAQQKLDLDREQFIAQLKKDAEAEIKQKTDNKMKKDGTPLNESEADLIRGYVLRKRIEDYNRGKTPDKQLPLPIDDIQRDQALALLNQTSDMLKGKDLVYYRYTQSLPPGQKPLPQEEFEASVKGKAANAEAVAKTEAALEISLPSVIDTAQNTLKHVTDTLNHPGLDKVVDPNTGGIAVVSKEGRAFVNYHDQLKADAFIQGVKSMVNMGALSNAEGQKIEKLMGRIDLRQHPSDFRAALREVQDTLREIIENKKGMQAEFKRRRDASGQQAPVGGGTATGQVQEGTVIQGPPDANGARTQHVFRKGAWDPPIP